MKFTVSTKLDSSLLGERMINEYSYQDSISESNDGMRRGLSFNVHCKVFGNIKNETKNEDGTYTYEYISIQKNENNQYSDGIRNPKESKLDLEAIIEELMFKYNIHEFLIDLQGDTQNIKNYYADINSRVTYVLTKEPTVKYSYNVYEKNPKYYEEPEEESHYWGKKFKSESIEDINRKLNGGISKDNYILYLLGYEIRAEYNIKMGLNEISKDENIDEFLNKISLEDFKYKTFEEALNNKIISIEDIKDTLSRESDISARKISNEILEQLFKESPETIKSFKQREIPVDILRKYSPNFDISKVNPSDLLPSDLDNVLQNVIQKDEINSVYGGPSKKELINEYYKYLQTFYEDPEALKKIIPVINTSDEYFFTSNAQEFISEISPEVLKESEIRDVLLDTKNIDLQQIISYQFSYDQNSSIKLMELLSKTVYKTSLKDINQILEIIKQNGIKDEDILQALRINGFNFSISSEDEIQQFKNLKIQGISLDDMRDRILKRKDFEFLTLVDEFSEDEATRLYKSILNEIQEKNNIQENKKFQVIFELMCNYSNSSQLFSKLTPEVKELSKRLMIQNLDVIENLQKSPVGYGSEFSRIMKIMARSFEITQEDMENIYNKCLNNGADMESIISELEQYLPEENRKNFEEKIKNANIYPNPKFFWLTDKNIKRIRINRSENRNSIKSKIQSDGRCFSIKIKTDMVGESKEGKKIDVNNLSKWLFGVPGARGNLTITKAGDYIQLPGNTPDEAVELIESILVEKEKNGQSK